MSTTMQVQEDACPECSGKLNTEKGETYCRNCGVVVEDSKLYEGKRFNGPKHGDNTVMDSMTNDTMHDKGLGSQISWRDKDIKGEVISDKSQYKRLRKWQTSMQFSGKELNRRHGLSQVHRVTSSMDLPKPIRRNAAQLFWRAHDKDVANGVGLYHVAVGCVFVASRQAKAIRELKEWEEQTGISKSKMHMLATLVQKELDVGYEPVTPMDYVEHILSNFNLRNEKRQRVFELVELAEENNVHMGKKPQSIVGAAIYMAVSRFSQERVSNIVGVSKRTLRQNYKAIEEVL